MTAERIKHLARILDRINEHAKAGRITEMMRWRLFAHVLAEYGREQ